MGVVVLIVYIVQQEEEDDNGHYATVSENAPQPNAAPIVPDVEDEDSDEEDETTIRE